MKGSKYAGTIGYINDALDDLLVESMGYIDDDLLVESIEYQSVPLLHRVVRNAVLKICACFVIVAALIFGLVFINSNEDNGIASLFVLTAYAAEDEEDVVSSNALGMGKAVPISVFETTKGVKGFVFSCNKEDEDASTSIVIISNGNYYDHIEEIVGITIDPTQNYYFYIPSEKEIEPYTLSLLLANTETQSVCQYKVAITNINETYYAELVEENIMDRITK